MCTLSERIRTWAGLDHAGFTAGPRPHAVVPAVGRRRVVAGPAAPAQSPAARLRARRPGRPRRPAAVAWQPRAAAEEEESGGQRETVRRAPEQTNGESRHKSL